MYGDKPETDTYPMRILRVGDVITPTSAPDITVTVVACYLMRPSDVDAYAWWLVICHLPHADHLRHPFAVWDAYDRPEGWSFSHGDYCPHLLSAIDRYNERGGKWGDMGDE